jgi:RNA recognition motif-containing protein
MSKRIYVGNLPFSATEADVRELFEAHGPVHSVSLVEDRDTGRPRGFGFVEMDDANADAAISALDGQDMGGRPLKINEARPRERSGGGRGGYGGGGGGGGRW